MNAGARTRVARAAAALLIAHCLSACSGGGVGGVFQPAGPTREELATSLEQAHPGHPILTAAINQCQEGRMGESTVQVCDFCFVAAGVAYSDNAFERGAYLEAVRKTGSAI